MFTRLLKLFAASAAGAAVALSMTACMDGPTPLGPTAQAAQDSASPLVLPLKPIPLPDPRLILYRWAEISAGNDHTCARKMIGTVYCWGGAELSQVGTRPFGTCDTGYRCYTKPTEVTGLEGTSAQISAGGNHTCSLQSTGAAYCWGSGDYGELAIGFGLYATYHSPYPVQGGLSFSAIAASYDNTCGIQASGGALYCWGRYNLPGATGSPDYSMPILIDNKWQSRVVASGTGGVCTIVAVYVTCGGANATGQAGQTPSSAAVAFPSTINVTAPNTVAMKYNFACSDLQDGTVACWGVNQYGQLGSGSTALYTNVVQSVGNGMALHGVTTGVYHACALTRENTAVCWGLNDYDQLGVSKNTGASRYSTPQAVYGGRTFISLAAGMSHTCGITTDYELYCWGKDNFYQLGTPLVDAGGNRIRGGGYTFEPVRVSDP